MITIRSLAILLLWAPALVAQGAEEPRSAAGLAAEAARVVKRLLASESSRDRAWGAHLAAKHRITAAAGDLRRAVAESKRNGNPRIDVALLFALDALIQLEARVPAAEVMPLFEAFPNEVVVLLSRFPASNRNALVEVLERYNHTSQWRAAANLLVKIRSAAFVEHLMKGLKISISVTVADKDGGDMLISSGMGAGGITGNTYHYPKGLPPVPYYELTTEARRGAVVVAPGRKTVYFVRRTIRKLPSRKSSRSDFIHERCGYLAELLELKAGALGFDPCPCVRVRFENVEALRARIDEVRQDAIDGYRELADSLVARGLIDAATAAKLEPTVSVEVHDKRENKTPALPDFSP